MKQFRVLYREFLFRIVDVELLSAHAQGDVSKLFGQFAALLIFLSVLFSVPSLNFSEGNLDPLEQLLLGFSAVHFLIATTMLVVGLFAVLSWDSMFPDRRDIFVLSPLPVRAPTLFFARVAALATALSLAVAVLHTPAGLFWPIGLNYSTDAQLVPAFTYDPAVAPVDADGLQSLLGRELAGAQKSGGPLAPGTGAGLAIGVVKNGQRRVFTFGTAKPDSMFEIGSITKTFTGLMLAQMVEKGSVRLDEPVRELLPEGTVNKPRGQEITALDLATQHSGLPRMPGNLNSADRSNPYADYRAADLYDYIAKRGVAKPSDAQFLYSNLGFGLLGVAMAERAGALWPDMVRDGVTRPLGMNDTVVSLSQDQQNRFLQGRDERNHPVHAWDVAEGLAGAGALRSTAGDMLTYLEANLRPEKFGRSSADRSFSAAVLRSHELHADVGPRTRIALGWLYNADSGTYQHSGGTGGFSSYACFNPKGNYGVVVLWNSSPAVPFADLLGEHIRQRFAGEPAYTLDLVSIPKVSGGVLRFFRLFLAYWITMLAAATFVFCCVLGLQGLASQLLPRRLFLRFSSILQLTTFSVLVSTFFLQPIVATPETLFRAQGHSILGWSPSFWFLGLFQHLSGSPALALLARRAWLALAISACLATAAYLRSYFRLLHRIVEEPDIVPLVRGYRLPGFGPAFGRAVFNFSTRTLMRSRQHRVILAFYLGVGLAITIYLVKSAAAQIPASVASVGGTWEQLGVPLLAASIIVMGCCVVGMRAVFSLPIDLRSNWIFRVAPLGGGPACLRARRRTLLALSVAPVWLFSALLFFWIAPWRMAAEHLVILGLLSIILTELCLAGEQKIPFTCSYLPGKSKFHVTFWLCVGVIIALVKKAAQFERNLMDRSSHYAWLVIAVVFLVILARWRNKATTLEEDIVNFEAEESEAIVVLGLGDADSRRLP